jgi:hypothetical protein
LSRANDAIDQASRFLIIGYGFNDDHLQTHLIPCIQRGVQTLLVTRSLSSRAMDLVKECPNITAIQSAKFAGAEGSEVFVRGKSHAYPNIALWELNSFVSEVFKT